MGVVCCLFCFGARNDPTFIMKLKDSKGDFTLGVFSEVQQFPFLPLLPRSTNVFAHLLSSSMNQNEEKKVELSLMFNLKFNNTK